MIPTQEKVNKITAQEFLTIPMKELKQLKQKVKEEIKQGFR